MAHSYTTKKTARPGWESVAGRFSDGKDCLAAFLALETAEVLSGVKPANLLNIANRNRSCGRNLYDLWQRHGSDLVEAGGLMALELVDRRDSLLLFLYNPISLAALLARKGVVALLRRTGYQNPADMAAALAELQSRLQYGAFPHEIGAFLGYPLKDVVGFMGLASVKFTCQGPWKIYGDPSGSLELAEACRQCRRNMARRLARCSDPLLCLQDGGSIRSGTPGRGTSPISARPSQTSRYD